MSERDALVAESLRDMNRTAPDHFGEQDAWATSLDTCAEPDKCRRCAMLHAAVARWRTVVTAEGPPDR